MPYLMRTIRKNRWYRDQTQTWLPDGEPPADSLKDIQTDGNELSVWLIEGDRSNLERVAVALAAGRDSLAELNYRLVPIEWVKRHRLPFQASTGATADLEANVRWHHDLSRLTAARLVSVARCLWRRGESGRITEKRIRQLLLEGVQSGQLNRSRINEKLAGKLRFAD